MATKVSEKITDFKATNMQILNAIRAVSSPLYQDRVPEATKETLNDSYNAILSYQATQNEFLHELVNRVVRVWVNSMSFNNPLKRFKKGLLEYGETVEEIFVEIAKAHPYDPELAEKTVFKREIPDVNAVFHRMNYQNFYKVTISEQQLRTAFVSDSGISDLVGRIVESLYNGSEFDEFVIMKDMITNAAANGRLTPVKITSKEPKDIVRAIKAMSNKMRFPRNDLNFAGVTNKTDIDKQILILDADFEATYGVDVLASAFNMDKVEFAGRVVMIDNFSDVYGAVAMLVDEDWFMIFDKLLEFTENYNGEGLYWNYFYHVWKIFSNSPFANAVLFVTNEDDIEAFNTTDFGVTEVTFSKKETTGDHPGDYQFTATATANEIGEITGKVNKFANTGIEYSIEPNNASTHISSGTYITEVGKLHISKHQSDGEIKVIATSVSDRSKTAEQVFTYTKS